MTLCNSTITMGYFIKEDGQLSVGEMKFNVVHNMSDEMLDQICTEIQKFPHSEMNATIFCLFVLAWTSVHDVPEVICITEEIYEKLCKI
jgi:hypothetical protein